MPVKEMGFPIKKHNRIDTLKNAKIDFEGKISGLNDAIEKEPDNVKLKNKKKGYEEEVKKINALLEQK